MNQGKLEVVNQEMARVNMHILRISKLKWMEWVNLFQLTIIYYCGQESLRRNGAALIVNNRVWKAVLGCSLKNGSMNSVHFQGKPFNIRVIQVYVPTSNAEEAEVEQFYKDLLEVTLQKCVLFIIGDWNAKVGSQEILWLAYAKEGSNYYIIALISQASKVMLKILQARIQQYVDCELPDVQAGFRKGRGIRDQIANMHWIIKKATEFQKNICSCC